MTGNEYLKDRIMGFVNGANSSLHPMRMARDAFQYGVNVSLDGLLPKTRPAFEAIVQLSSADDFQGAAIYHLSGADKLVYICNDKLYTYDFASGLTTYITDVFSGAGNVMHHFCQAERYMVIQDGSETSTWATTNWPVILDGNSLVDQSAITDTERVPKGKMMAYGHGRLFVATEYIYTDSGWSSNLGRVGFVAGDLIKAQTPSEILNFTETNYLNGGGRIAMPSEAGEIQTMKILQNNQTGTGQGPLIVSAENAWSAYQIDAPREQWFDIDLGTVLYSGHDLGCYGDNATDYSNNSLVYRTHKSFRMVHDASAKSQGNQAFINSPISAEVADILHSYPPQTTMHVSAASAFPRIFFSGAFEDDECKSIISLNAELFGAIAGASTPVYEGEWTGYTFKQIISRQDKDDIYGVLFIAKDFTDRVSLFRLVDADPDIERPTCQIYTRYYDFENPDFGKFLRHAVVNVMDIKGPVSLKIYYRSDGNSLWGTSREFTLTANGLPQSVRQVKIPFEHAQDPTINGQMQAGNRFQLCIEWTGVCTIGAIVLCADETAIPETTVTDSGNTGELVASSTLVDLSRYSYEV